MMFALSFGILSKPVKAIENRLSIAAVCIHTMCSCLSFQLVRTEGREGRREGRREKEYLDSRPGDILMFVSMPK